MGTATKIEWCDHTASPWYGCQHAELPGGGMHPGCDNCYAEALSKRNPGTLGEWGPAGVRFVSKSFRKACKRFQKQAEKEGRRVSVFPSLCDPFEEWNGNLHFTEKNDQGVTESTVAWWRSDIGVCRAGDTTVGNVRGERLATMADCRRDLFNSIDSNPLVDYLLLTKRPQNVRRMWPSADILSGITGGDCPAYWSNVQLLYSASDQASLESGFEDLLRCDELVPLIGLSLEPLLGPIEIPRTLAKCPNCGRDPKAVGLRDSRSEPFSYFCSRSSCGDQYALPSVGWVIVGGESGPNARPCNVAWIRSIVAQCEAMAVPCFVKQLGSNPSEEHDGSDFELCDTTGMRSLELKDKKGGDWNEWPEDLRIRQFPEVAHV